MHSDRGSQYASGEYQALLQQHGLICSMSRKGNCWDTQSIMEENACAESDPCWDWPVAFALTCRFGQSVPRALPGLMLVT